MENSDSPGNVTRLRACQPVEVPEGLARLQRHLDPPCGAHDLELFCASEMNDFTTDTIIFYLTILGAEVEDFLIRH